MWIGEDQQRLLDEETTRHNAEVAAYERDAADEELAFQATIDSYYTQ
jgi:hypothetical protein